MKFIKDIFKVEKEKARARNLPTMDLRDNLKLGVGNPQKRRAFELELKRRKEEDILKKARLKKKKKTILDGKSISERDDLFGETEFKDFTDNLDDIKF